MDIFESLTSSQQELIIKHLNLIIEANKTTNLTRIDSVEEAMLLHVEDSLLGLKEVDDAPEGLYGDMGSGAGYPGIPLAVGTGRKTVLIDARKRKMEIAGKIIKELGLDDQVTTFAGRAELLARTQSKRYAVLTARALSKTNVLLELASPLLRQGGVLVCYKAKVTDEELADAKRVLPLVGMSFKSDRKFLLGGIYQRRILAFEKTAEPKVKLPRQEGQAQKQPL